MKTAMACGLALGLAGAALGARADNASCCKVTGATAANCPAAACTTGEGKICLDANGITMPELARRLSEMFGVEVRVLGSGFETLKLKVCAATPEAALTQIAQALHARWRQAFIFGAGTATPRRAIAERAVTVTFQGAPAASAALFTAAQAGGVVIADRPISGKVTFHGKAVPVSMALDAIAVASGQNWKPAYVLQVGPETLVTRQGDHGTSAGTEGLLHARPGSPLSHLHHSPSGSEEIAPAPGMIVKDPQAELERLEKESFRRQELGEWASVFTQETPRETRRAIRDLRIRVETTIQKLESYPPQNREMGVAMWRARYERMLADAKRLTPDQQKEVQPVLDVMKYLAAPSN